MTSKPFHLVIDCPDQIGVVAAVTQFIAQYKGSIVEADQHTDIESQWFFMRYTINRDGFELSRDNFADKFAKIAQRFNMCWTLHDPMLKKRILILVSKASHCLEELLYLWHSKLLNGEVVGVVSNHSDLADRVEWHKLPYHHIPIHTDTKSKHFEQIVKLFQQYQPDVIVLARYMQVLPQSICQNYAGRIINIHHSFLPSFMGANPYAQAYAKGVKLIGATAHYVTPKLDQGPIIEQDVIRISHRQSLADVIRLGKDIERRVLARAVEAHLDDRVAIHHNKTIVFGA